MIKYIRDIRRTQTIDTIGPAIQTYREHLLSAPMGAIEEKNAYDFIRKIKREPLTGGPYPGLSLFEAANRIMTDLTVLYGVKQLLNFSFGGTKFTEFKILLGNEDHQDHDIMSKSGGYSLHCEAFNVAPSFFAGKRRISMAKLRDNRPQDCFIVLLYNSDATTKTYQAEANEYHFGIDITMNAL